MVDVSDKNITHRKALASGEIVLSAEIVKLIKDKKMPKGDPLSIAEVNQYISFISTYSYKKTREVMAVGPNSRLGK